MILARLALSPHLSPTLSAIWTLSRDDFGPSCHEMTLARLTLSPDFVSPFVCHFVSHFVPHLDLVTRWFWRVSLCVPLCLPPLPLSPIWALSQTDFRPACFVSHYVSNCVYSCVRSCHDMNQALSPTLSPMCTLSWNDFCAAPFVSRFVSPLFPTLSPTWLPFAPCHEMILARRRSVSHIHHCTAKKSCQKPTSCCLSIGVDAVATVDQLIPVLLWVNARED